MSELKISGYAEISNYKDSIPNINGGTINPDNKNIEPSVGNNNTSNINVNNTPLKASNAEVEKNLNFKSNISNDLNPIYGSTGSKVNNIYKLNDNNISNSIIDEIKKKLQDYLNKLYNENICVDLESNLLYYFNEIQIIENKDFKDNNLNLNGNSLKIIYDCVYKIPDNSYFKCIPESEFELSPEIKEKHSLCFLETTCIYYPENEKKEKPLNNVPNKVIEFNFELEDIEHSSKKFYIFTIGLYNKNKLLFNNAIIMFFIDIEELKKQVKKN